MQRRAITLTGTALAIVLACPAIAWAQPAAKGGEASVEVDEIIVTAQKRSERLIDVPAAVTAISGETLTERNQGQIETFAASTPGLSFNQAAGGLQITLRGLNASGQGATTAVLVDNVPLTSASSYQQATTPNFDTYDLERIEVLRGPQGTLYGASALGGLVKYVPKAPDLDAFEGTGQVELNTVDDGEEGGSVRGAVNVPLVEGVLGLRVSGGYERLPGYVQNPLGGDSNVNGGERYGARGALLWQASPDLSVNLGVIWQRDDLGALALVELVGAQATPSTPPANAASIANGGRLQRNSRIGEPVTREAQVYSGTVDYDAGFATFSSITSLADTEFNQTADVGYENAAPGFTFGDLTGILYGQPTSVRARNLTSVRRVSQEFRLVSTPGDGPVDYLAGLFYTDEDSRLIQTFDVLSTAQPPVILTAPFPGGRIDIPASYRELAGFGQLTWNVTPQLNVTAGGRYARNWQKSQSRKYFGLATQLTGDVIDPVSKNEDDKATWSVAVSWRPVDRVNLYARGASGYRPGGPNATPPVVPVGFQTRYGPDTTVNYELGAKGELFDRRLAFDVSLFTVDWSNIQIPTTFVDPLTGVPFNITTNAGEARSQGIEYSLRFAATDQLTLSVTGARTNAELVSDAPTIQGRSGDRLAYVPDFTNTVSLDYRAPVGSSAEVFFGVDWAYVGERYSAFSPTAVNTSHQKLPSYDSVNLRGGVDFGRYSLDVYVTNAGNSRGLYSYNSAGGAAGTGTGVVQQPRTVGVRFSADF